MLVRKKLNWSFFRKLKKTLAYGIDVTHLDSHMFALYLNPEYLTVYKKIGKEYKLPILLNKDYLTSFGLNTEKNLDKGDIVVDNLYMAFPEDTKKGMEN